MTRTNQGPTRWAAIALAGLLLGVAGCQDPERERYMAPSLSQQHEQAEVVPMAVRPAEPCANGCRFGAYTR